MKGKILDFHQDNVGNWVADLQCGHRHHLRHQPPWTTRQWVLTAEGRKRFIGSKLHCRECETQSIDQGREMEESKPQQKARRIAEAVKAESIKAAIEAYQRAKMSGLCQEGAWDCAIDAMRTLDAESIIKNLPE